MNGEICNLITTATYGNRYLREGVSPNLVLGDEQGPFLHDFLLTYIQKAGLFKREKIIAKSFDHWLKLQKDQRASRFHLIYVSNPEGPLPEHIASAFANSGGHWFVGVERDGLVSVWMTESEFKDDGFKNVDGITKPGWEITTKKWIELPVTDLPRRVPVDLCTERLKAVLSELVQFTESLEWDNWKACFEKSLRQLSGVNENNFVSSNKIIPSGFLNKKAESLLMACMDAWVFGGMGSWNDCSPSDVEAKKKYDRLTSTLYRTVCHSIVASTNSI